jgi:hypothetical protein
VLDEPHIVPQFAVELFINTQVVHTWYLSVTVVKLYPIRPKQNIKNAALNSSQFQFYQIRGKKIGKSEAGGGVWSLIKVHKDLGELR